MSTKAKSKNASANSPAPGTPSRAKSGEGEGKTEGKNDGAGRAELVTVYLQSDRGRRGSWMVAGLVIGGLLIWKFGTVAAAGGVVLLVLGLYHTWFFIQSLLHEAGALVVDAEHVSLPTGLSRGEPTRVAAGSIGAAYFLRQAVPWNRSAPVLVIEVGDRAYVYPRDWFASEADQRRVMHAVLPLISAASGAAPVASGVTSGDASVAVVK